MVNSLVGLAAGVVILIVFFWLIIIGLVVWAFVFWILMIVDCATKKFKNDTDKIVWILVIIFTHIIGALIYYFIVKRKNRKLNIK